MLAGVQLRDMPRDPPGEAWQVTRLTSLTDLNPQVLADPMNWVTGSIVVSPLGREAVSFSEVRLHSLPKCDPYPWTSEVCQRQRYPWQG